jgi:hypothetical protein
MKLMLKNARLSFPSLHEHASYQGQDLGKYEATFLIPKNSDDAKAVQAAIKEVGNDVLGDAWSKAKLCILDGDSKDYDGYEGMWAVKATTKKRPIVLDKDKSALTAEDDKPYAGCYVNASISIYAFQNNYGKFVQAQLNAVQFSKDGDAFGGGDTFSVDEFDDISDGDDDDAPF